MALDHSRLIRERDVALSLQQSLLPERLPEMPGLTLAARYRPGQGGLVGGDWYDVDPAARRAASALAMGDVVSRGIRAASVMGQLRHALRTRALEGDEPVDARPRYMGELVRGARPARDGHARLRGGRLLGRRELRYVSAGHPPALVARERRGRGSSTRRAGVPLGAVAHPRYDEAAAQLEPDSLIVLYTDGLIERRDRLDRRGPRSG